MNEGPEYVLIAVQHDEHDDIIDLKIVFVSDDKDECIREMITADLQGRHLLLYCMDKKERIDRKRYKF